MSKLKGEFRSLAQRASTQFRQRFGGEGGGKTAMWHAAATLSIAAAVALVVNMPNHVMLFFILTVASIWVGASTAIREIVDERDLLRNEMRAGLSIFSYVTAKLIYTATLAIGDGFLLAFGLNSIGRLRDSLLGDWAACSLLVFCGSCIGLIISAACRSSQTAMQILPLALIPQVMLAGLVFPVSPVPLEESVVQVMTLGPNQEPLTPLERWLDSVGRREDLSHAFLNRSYARLTGIADLMASRWGAEALLAVHTTELRISPPASNLAALVVNHSLGSLTRGRDVRLKLQETLGRLIAWSKSQVDSNQKQHESDFDPAKPVPLDSNPAFYFKMLVLLAIAKSALVYITLTVRTPIRDVGRY